jgi:nicotinamide riboside transporter PnuC
MSYGGITPKDPNTAMIIELVGGLFGLLGIGYLYTGQTEAGLIRLVVWIIYNAIAWIAIVILASFIIGCFCIPVQLIIQIGVPIWSGLTLKKNMEQGFQNNSG